MLQNTRELLGNKLTALDGDIGEIKDFYFDDDLWVIRYLAADAESSLKRPVVLLSPHALGAWDPVQKTLQVKLLKKRIQNSPSIDLHQPISQKFEIEYYEYYGWPVYWNGGALWGLGGSPGMLPPSIDELESFLEDREREFKHLQSVQLVTGFRLQASDGLIGQLTGFTMEDTNWDIRELVVETGDWFSGKEILISTTRVDRISYKESKVYVTLTRKDIGLTQENGFVKTESTSPRKETGRRRHE